MDNLISIRNLKLDLMTTAGIVHAVRNINLDIAGGEIHGIVGESGCGKTMMAKSILRLHDEKRANYSGEILYEGKKDILKMSRKELLELRGGKISMIFQDPVTTLNPLYTVGDQIAEILLLHTGCAKKRAAEQAAGLLEQVGIYPGAKRAKQYPFEMSGGMLQRASIAMSLACNPRLLIADEPTTALDVTLQAQVLELLKRLQQRLESSILLITHNFGVVAEICDRVSVMYAGQIVETGRVVDIFDNPCHPYTRDLIRAIPGSGNRGRRLVSIPGAPPKLNRPIKGCPYSDRCAYADEICAFRPPEMHKADEGHQYLCHLDPAGVQTEAGVIA